MSLTSRGTYALIAAAAILAAAPAGARDQIRIVGSSTVYPFATAVAEEFGRSSKFKTPIIESTGTGGGMKLFCAGVGVEHPDLTNASRRIKQTEFDQCSANGVKAITEIKIGYDGIVVANAKKSPRYKVSLQQLFLRGRAHREPEQDLEGRRSVAAERKD
jgi:phosphate transport system substrate-binding protein